MKTSDLLILAIIVTLFLFAIFIAIGETAVLRMTRVKAIALEEDGRRGARRLVQLLEKPEQTVNAVTLLALAAQTITANLVGVVIAANHGVWFTIGVFVLNFLIFFVFSEAAPKTWAIQHSTRAALAVAPMLWFLTSFWPVRVMARGLLGFVNWILPGKGLKDGPFVTEEEIRAMADVAAGEAAIEHEEREMIHSIFEFGDTVVREVMRPRPDIVGVEQDATVEEAVRTMIDAGFSRVPAYEAGSEEITGLLYLKDLVRRSTQGDLRGLVQSSVRPAQFVPESKKVNDLLQQMREQKFHMAIVVDEYGDTAGLITLEDLLEEIVGEITDEYDVEEPEIEQLSDTVFRVPGGTNIGDLNELLECHLPDDEWDTVGGLVFNLLGHIPVNGECVVLDGMEFCTERVEGRRIASVVVTVLPTIDAHEGSTIESA